MPPARKDCRPNEKLGPEPARHVRWREGYERTLYLKGLQAGLPWRAVVVAGYLAHAHSNDRAKDVYPSQTHIAEKLGMSVRSVGRYVAMLVAAGWLQVERRSERVEGGRWRSLSNLTRFIMPAEIEAELRAQQNAAGAKTRAEHRRDARQEQRRPTVVDQEASQRAAMAAAHPEDLVVATSSPPPPLLERLERLRRRATGPPRG